MSIENVQAQDLERSTAHFWEYLFCCVIVAIGLATKAEGSDVLRVYVVDRDSRAVVGALLTDVSTHSTICRTDGTGHCTMQRHGGIVFEVSAPGFSNQRVAVEEFASETIVTLHVASKAIVVVNGDADSAGATEHSVSFRAEDIDRLPVWLRKAESLPAIAPGTVNRPTDDEWGQGISTAGMRLTTTNSTMDQMPNRVERRGGLALQPSLDAVAEMRVLSSGYSAEYGHTPGAQIVMITRSGSDQFHGSVYDYARDRLGGVIGGPIRRDRTFFFASYEGNNTDYGNPVTSGVPSLSELQGNFSTLSSPLHIPGFAQRSTAGSRIFVIPSAAISPVAEKLLALIPPSTSGMADNEGEHSGSQQMLVRLDDQWNTSSRLMLRLARMDYKSVLQPYSQQILPAAWPLNRDITNSVAASYNYTVATSTFEVRTSYMGTVGSSKGACHDDPRYEITLADSSPSAGCPIVSITGFLPFGDAFHLYSYRSSPFEVAADFSRTGRGRNDVKVGAAFDHVHYQSQDPTQENGYFSFTGQYTGDPVADFLLFLPSTALRSFDSAASKGSLNQVTLSAYVQDYLRVTPRFQLDLGVRMEYLPQMVGHSQNLRSFWPQLGSVQHGNEQDLLRSQGAIVSPRVGFIWSLNNKTLFRGGAGLFGGEDDLASTLGQLTDAQLPRSAVTAAPGLQSFNASAPNWIPITPGVTRGIDPRNLTSVIYEYTLAVERSFPDNVVIAASYTGSRGTHLGRLYNINQALPTGSLDASGQPVLTRPYPNLGDVLFEDHGAYSRYNEGRIEVRKQITGGVHFRLAYIYSKSIDDASAVTETNWSGMEYAQDPRNLGAERGPSDFDHRQRVAGFVTLQLDHLTHAAPLRRSSFSAVANAMSGQPFTVLVNDNLRPDLVGDPYTNVPAGHFFNPAAFAAHVPTAAQPYLFGNVGRNSLRGPYFNTIDLAFNKGFKLRRIMIDLRVECFNVLDRDVHSITNYIEPDFGMARSSLNQSRLIIAGGRIGF